MTTRQLFMEDAYRKSAPGTVLRLTDEGGVMLDASLFYAQGGGQPGDGGTLDWEGGRLRIATTVKGKDGEIVMVPAEPGALPPVGAKVDQRLDWDRRFAHMRVHTALHLLSVVIPLAVTGGAIGAEKGRLDFDMPDAPEDKMILQGRLNALIERRRDTLFLVNARQHAPRFRGAAIVLNLAEAAMLCGLIKAPNIYSPLRDQERARGARNHVLDRINELFRNLE